MIACQSNEHQLAVVGDLYQADYGGYMVPAVFQQYNAEYDFPGPELLGHELGPSVSKFAQGNANRMMGVAMVIKNCLTYPATDHSYDPNSDTIAGMGMSTNDYWGDYLRNIAMGD
jgi:hypothetical protein